MGISTHRFKSTENGSSMLSMVNRTGKLWKYQNKIDLQHLELRLKPPCWCETLSDLCIMFSTTGSSYCRTDSDASYPKTVFKGHSQGLGKYTPISRCCSSCPATYLVLGETASMECRPRGNRRYGYVSLTVERELPGASSWEHSV